MDAFVSLGGDNQKQTTISRDKLESVLNDFELTLDMKVIKYLILEICGDTWRRYQGNRLYSILPTFE